MGCLLCTWVPNSMEAIFFSDHHQLQSSLSAVFHGFPICHLSRLCSRVGFRLHGGFSSLTSFCQLSAWIFNQQLLHTFTSLTGEGRRSSSCCTSTTITSVWTQNVTWQSGWEQQGFNGPLVVEFVTASKITVLKWKCSMLFFSPYNIV